MGNEKIRNTSELRELLIETIAEVRNGNMDPKTATTIATLSTTILRSAKIDLDYLRFFEGNQRAVGSQAKSLPLIEAESAKVDHAG